MEGIGELFLRNGSVEELAVDDELREHLLERGTYEKHNVSISEIIQVHQGAPKYFLNRGHHRAPVIMVGPTGTGRLLCVPVEPVGRMGVWRPVTAFEANAHHRDAYAGGSS